MSEAERKRKSAEAAEEAKKAFEYNGYVIFRDAGYYELWAVKKLKETDKLPEVTGHFQSREPAMRAIDNAVAAKEAH